MDGKTLLVYPLVLNLSTLLDFLVLNPIAIYLILEVCHSVRTLENTYGTSKFRYSRAQQALTALGWLTAATGSMVLYIHFFFGGGYLDAVVTRTPEGVSFLTATGWIASFWTVLFMYSLGQAMLCQIIYLRLVSNLTPTEVRYQPFSLDEAGGLRPLGEPALKFLRLNFLLLLIFSLFAVQDKVLFDVKESIRGVGVLVYLAVSVPLFTVPVFKLRSIMRRRREMIGDQILDRFETSSLEDVDRLGKSEVEVADSLNALLAIYSCLKKLPTWPLPIRQSFESFTILTGPALTLLPKVKPLLGQLSAILSGWFGRLGLPR